MYKLITSCPANEVWVDHGVLYLRDYKRNSAVFSYSLEEQVEQIIPFTHSELSWWIYLRGGLWLVQYEGASKEDTHIYSIEGVWQQTIPRMHADLYILPTKEDWVYLINNRFVKYNLSTHEYRDLGQFSLKKPSYIRGVTVVSTSSLVRDRVSWWLCEIKTA